MYSVVVYRPVRMDTSTTARANLHITSNGRYRQWASATTSRTGGSAIHWNEPYAGTGHPSLTTTPFAVGQEARGHPSE